MERLIKQNSNGIVEYRVYEVDNGKIILRIYNAEIFNDQVLLARFKERVQVVNECELEGLPKYEMEIEKNGKIILSRDYIEGDTLNKILKNKNFSCSEALDLIKKIVEIIKKLHEEGIVFGNLTPNSIIIDKNGKVNLINIRFLDTLPENLSFNEEYFSYMTKYMSPEVAMGDLGGKTSDLYSIGIILYEMIHGVTPFEHNDPVMVAWGHVNRIPEYGDHVDEKSKSIIEILLRKDKEERLSDGGKLLKILNEEDEKIPNLPHEHQDEINKHYFSYLKGKYVDGENSKDSFSMNMFLVSILLLLVFLLPVIWFMQPSSYEIVYKIDSNKLFSENFDHYYYKKVISLPEVEKINYKDGEAIVKLKLEKDEGFLKKIQSIFSSQFLPKCEIDLKGNKIIKIHFSKSEKRREINIALATLSQKIHLRLRKEGISSYNLKSEETGILKLNISKSIDYDKVMHLFMKNHVSIHQLINGNFNKKLDIKNGLIVKNDIDKKFSELIMINSKRIKKINPVQNEMEIFWNLVGTMNLQNSFENRKLSINSNFMLDAIPSINLEKSFKQVISKSNSLIVSKNNVCDSKIFLNGKIRITKKKEFIFEPLRNYKSNKNKKKTFSFLPLVIVIDDRATAIIYNPDKISPDSGLIYGFKDRKDIFDFVNMIQSSLPSYVMVK